METSMFSVVRATNRYLRYGGIGATAPGGAAVVERAATNQPFGGETMFHRVTIIGFVSSDPTMRYTPDGTPVTNFSVATRQVVSKERCQECPSGWKESLNGKNWELTTWFRVSCAPRSA